MSDHWRLALRYAAWIIVAAVLISAVLFIVSGAGHAWSFLYGAGAAVLSFVSTALTISLFAGRSMAAGVMIGAGSDRESVVWGKRGDLGGRRIL